MPDSVDPYQRANPIEGLTNRPAENPGRSKGKSKGKGKKSADPYEPLPPPKNNTQGGNTSNTVGGRVPGSGSDNGASRGPQSVGTGDGGNDGRGIDGGEEIVLASGTQLNPNELCAYDQTWVCCCCGSKLEVVGIVLTCVNLPCGHGQRCLDHHRI